MPVRPEEKIRCSFCGKNQDQVRKMIAGSNGVYICDECIEVCSEIIEEEFEYDDDRREFDLCTSNNVTIEYRPSK